MSLLRNSSSNIWRSVGTGVGAIEMEGALVVGRGVGIKDELGKAVGAIEGDVDSDGTSLGCVVREGTRDGYSDGGSDGMADMLGFIDGPCEIEGCMDG